MKRSESCGRELALWSIYAEDMEGDASSVLVSNDECPVSPESLSFSRHLIDGVRDRREEIDGIIRRHLRNWTMDRLRAIDRCILRIAVYEMVYFKKTPPKVIFDEYIELAKKYGDKDSGTFVNGLLNAVCEEFG